MTIIDETTAGLLFRANNSVDSGDSNVTVILTQKTLTGLRAQSSQATTVAAAIAS